MQTCARDLVGGNSQIRASLHKPGQGPQQLQHYYNAVGIFIRGDYLMYISP